MTEAEISEKFQTLLGLADECISPEDLQRLLEYKASKKENFVLYDGFEPSGRMHIAQGIFKSLLVNKCTASPIPATFVFWVADIFALANNKMGGDMEKIRAVGEYFVQVWKASGMDITASRVQFKWATNEIAQNPQLYFSLLFDVAKRVTVARISKCCQIMGRKENTLSVAQILYPLMQCSDVFFLGADVCQLGLDQRKVNMLARDYCDLSGRRKKNKPIILSHKMIAGLKQGQEKMSKSDPDSAIFMEDDLDSIRRKITQAFCPRNDTEVNPCLEYIEHILFNIKDFVFLEKFSTFDQVKDAFLKGEITEQVLKNEIILRLNELIAPVRTHFEQDEEAKDLLTRIKMYKSQEKESQVVQEFFPDISKLISSDKSVSTAIFFPTVGKLKLSFDVAINAVLEIKKSLLSCTLDNQLVVLVLPDLTSIGMNAYGAHKKTKCEEIISAVLQIYLFAINQFLSDTERSKVQVIKQSDLFFADTTPFLINVMNAGRNVLLQDLQSVRKQDEGVGPLLSAVFRAAEVVSLRPENTVLLDEDEQNAFTVFKPFWGLARFGPTRYIAQKNFSVKLLEKIGVDPKVSNGELLLTDTVLEAKKKLKRSFCEPENVDFNPALQLAILCSFGDGNLIENDKNGIEINGNVYGTEQELKDAVRKGDVHPNDLKQVTEPLLQKLYEKLSGLHDKKSEVGKAVEIFQRYFKRVTK